MKKAEGFREEEGQMELMSTAAHIQSPWFLASAWGIFRKWALVDFFLMARKKRLTTGAVWVLTLS